MTRIALGLAFVSAIATVLPAVCIACECINVERPCEYLRSDAAFVDVLGLHLFGLRVNQELDVRFHKCWVRKDVESIASFAEGLECGVEIHPLVHNRQAAAK